MGSIFMSSSHQHINLKSGNGLKRLFSSLYLSFSVSLSLCLALSLPLSSVLFFFSSLAICSYILYSFTSEKWFCHRWFIGWCIGCFSMCACIFVFDSYVNGSHHNGSWYIGKKQINPPFRWQLKKTVNTKK